MLTPIKTRSCAYEKVISQQFDYNNTCNLPIWIRVGQGPTELAVGAGGGCLDIFTLDYPFCPLSPSLWETPDID